MNIERCMEEGEIHCSSGELELRGLNISVGNEEI